MPDQSPDKMSESELHKLYEDGKHRRYALLFSINGGAFAVAKVITQDCSKHQTVLGGLRLWELSLGMMAVTLVMAWDIFKFGTQMREKLHGEVFSKTGRWVLRLLGGLIIAGWLLVGLPEPQ